MAKKINTYEGMFLLPSGQAATASAYEPVLKILERYGAEVIRADIWDERPLAYEIQGQKQGIYVLIYFTLETSEVIHVEHDCNLSDGITRVQILRRDGLTDEDIVKEFAMSGVVSEVSSSTETSTEKETESTESTPETSNQAPATEETVKSTPVEETASDDSESIV